MDEYKPLIYGETVILDYLTSKDFSPKDLVVVSPDVGGVARARAFAKKLCDAPMAGAYTRPLSSST